MTSSIINLCKEQAPYKVSFLGNTEVNLYLSCSGCTLGNVERNTESDS